MAADHLFRCDVLGLVVAHLNRLDAAMLSLTCIQAAAQVRALQLSPAPRVCICTSGNYQLLLLQLTPEGRAYLGHQQRDTVSSRTRNRLHGAPCQLDVACVFDKCRPPQWLTGTAACPYDHCLYVAAYGTDSNDASTSATPSADTPPSTRRIPGRAGTDAPSQILRFSTGTLRPCGRLVSGPAIQDPEGLAFAKQACYVASAGHASLLCVALPDGSIRQSLALAGNAVPWGMAAWDPSTYPEHGFAAQQAARVQQHQPQETQEDTRPGGMCSGQGQRTGERATTANANAASADDVLADDAAFDTAAAASCLLVAVQADLSKKQYWLPPAGPASGVLLCVPLSCDGTMMSVREWSRVKIKRPSGVSIDHAGHVWTTSLEQQLLRFSGPCHPNNGCLLQRVDLMQLLPAQAACLYPMDCQSVVQQAQAAGLRANSGSLVQGAAANDNSCGQRCAAMSCLLIVTAHAGPKLPGAVAVFKVEEEPAGQHAQGFSGQASTSIRLVSFWQDRLLQQPNMVAAF